MEKYEVGDTFELRELYSNEEWAELDRGQSIAFGRNFFSFTSKIEPGKLNLLIIAAKMDVGQDMSC